MGDEVNLGDYVGLIKRRWLLILGVMVLAILLAGMISWAIKPTYEATVTITIPQTFAPEFPFNQIPPTAVQVTFLQSNDVAVQAVQNLARMGRNENQGFLMTKVRIVSDPLDRSVIRITAQADTPQLAAMYANAWGEAGVQELSRRFIGNALVTKEKQVQFAREALEKADTALTNFTKSNDLTWTSVASLDINGTPRIVISNTAKLSGLSSADSATLARLLQDEYAAGIIYSKLAMQYTQGRVVAQAPSDIPQLLSSAVEPTAPIQPKAFQNIAIAAALGLIAGLLVAFVVDFVARKN